MYSFIFYNETIPGHIQISQVPSRNEPDADGEINYPYIFHQIAKLGYKGWIGCEYHPRGKRLQYFHHPSKMQFGGVCHKLNADCRTEVLQVLVSLNNAQDGLNFGFNSKVFNLQVLKKLLW